jgi:hypothetical protein
MCAIEFQNSRISGVRTAHKLLQEKRLFRIKTSQGQKSVRKVRLLPHFFFFFFSFIREKPAHKTEIRSPVSPTEQD